MSFSLKLILVLLIPSSFFNLGICCYLFRKIFRLQGRARRYYPVFLCFFFYGSGENTRRTNARAAPSREKSGMKSPTAKGAVHPRATYSVGVEQLYGPDHIELPGHEELDSHIPRERGNVVLNCPLVNLFKKLLGGLFDKENKE